MANLSAYSAAPPAALHAGGHPGAAVSVLGTPGVSTVRTYAMGELGPVGKGVQTGVQEGTIGANVPGPGLLTPEQQLAISVAGTPGVSTIRARATGQPLGPVRTLVIGNTGVPFRSLYTPFHVLIPIAGTLVIGLVMGLVFVGTSLAWLIATQVGYRLLWADESGG